MNNDPASYASLDDSIGSSLASEIDDNANVFEIPAITPIPEPTPTPATSPAQAQIRVGDIIQFGPYDWRVLDVQGNQALIITDRVITNRAYHHTNEAVTWETREVRQWLNSEFFASFSPANQARIAETYVVNNSNPWWIVARGGNNTTDRIFLLSIEEAVEIFGDSGQLDNRPHARSLINDEFNQTRIAIDVNGSASRWGLRSPGSTPSFAALIGHVDYGSLNVRGSNVVRSDRAGVRPALWLYLD